MSNRWMTLVVTVSCPAEGLFPVGGLASAAEGGSHGPWDKPGEALSGVLEHNLPLPWLLPASVTCRTGRWSWGIACAGAGRAAPHGCGHDRERLEFRPFPGADGVTADLSGECSGKWFIP